MTLDTQVTYLGGGHALDEYALRDPDDSAGGVILFHRRFYDTSGGPPGTLSFSAQPLSVADTWSPRPRLSVNLGVRLDHVTREDQKFGQRIQDSWDLGPRLGASY